MKPLHAARSPFVKICGVTQPADAAMIVRCGADALGVNLFAGSKRHVAIEEAARWLPGLAGQILRVAVVVDPADSELEAIHHAGVFDAIQFHGSETPERCETAGFDIWIKAVRVRAAECLEAAMTYRTPNLLLDAWVDGAPGGTGCRLDWRLAADFVAANPDRRVLVAGGLTPNNAAEAMRIVSPFGLDVASGVEITPRAKEEYLVREFVRAARGEPAGD